MGKFKKALKDLVKDEALIKEFRYAYHKGEIKTEVLLGMLQHGDISLYEYLQIIKEEKKK